MNSNDKKITFVGFGVLFLMIITALVFGSNVSEGEQGRSSLSADILKDYPINRTTESFSGDLNAGASQTFEIDLSGKLLKNISATLTWSDEQDLAGRPRIRRYDNQPDTFSLSVSDLEGNITDEGSASNPQGNEGTVTVMITNDDADLVMLLDGGYEGETWAVDVTMVDAGMWAPRIGVIGFTDNGNSFSLVVEYEFYEILELRGE